MTPQNVLNAIVFGIFNAFVSGKNPPRMKKYVFGVNEVPNLNRAINLGLMQFEPNEARAIRNHMDLLKKQILTNSPWKF